MALSRLNIRLQPLQCHCHSSTFDCDRYNVIVTAQHSIAAATMPLQPDTMRSYLTNPRLLHTESSHRPAMPA
jgi:hypothetical protein